MNKNTKAMKYVIEPITKMSRSEMTVIGGNKKKAAAIDGIWIRANETMYLLVEAEQVTTVLIDGDTMGCSCGRCDAGTVCEHVLAFEALKSTPQLSIKSPEYRWLSGYLLSACGWKSVDGYLYPSLDSDLPEDEASCAPDEEEAPKLDPVNEDKPLDTGVDDEQEPKMFKRKCHYCVFTEQGGDRDRVIANVAEHQKTCPKNPANKKTSEEQPTDPVVKESSTTEPKAISTKSATVVEPPEEEMPHPSKKFTCEMCGAEYDSADDVLNCIERCKEKKVLDDTKALVTQDTTSKDDAWTDAQLEVMRNTVAANATPEEFAYFLNVAKYSGLNPFLREIYFVKNEKGQTTIITGRDGYLTIAKRDPRFRGIHSMEVCENDEFEMSFEEGVMKVSKHKITNIADRGEIIGAWACGRMGGQDPITIFASMKEYDKSGNPKGGKIWKQYTSSMIRKVAESMVLKRIAGISGLVTEAEIGGTDLIQIEIGE